MPANQSEIIVCTPKSIPHASDDPVLAAQRAIEIYPGNAPQVPVGTMMFVSVDDPGFLAVLTTKYWGPKGVRLTTAFMEQTSVEDRNEILKYLNMWSEYCNAQFVYSTTDPMVRISRGNGGYWSYLGTDILGIPKNEPTMNLQAITARTSDKEKRRVIPHEGGHTLGFSHEHTRKEIIDLIDRQKAIQYFRQTQGWDERTTIQQVLTPLKASDIKGTAEAEQTSIMTYQLPGFIMKNGIAVPGGDTISKKDAEFARSLYPKEVVIPPPPVEPPTPPSGTSFRFKKEDVIIGGQRYTAEWALSASPSSTLQGQIEEQDMSKSKPVALNAEVLSAQQAQLATLCAEVGEIARAGFSPCETVKKLREKLDSINVILATLSGFVPALKGVPAAIEAAIALGETLCSLLQKKAGGAVEGELV